MARDQKAYQLLASLNYKGVKYTLHSDPLRPLLEAMHTRTDHLRWNVEDWGGYQTEWEIEGGRLYLIDVFGFDLGTGRQLKLSKLFEEFIGGTVLASWYFGEIHFPCGAVRRHPSGLGLISEGLMKFIVLEILVIAVPEKSSSLRETPV